MTTKTQAYFGDGVYAEFDGFHVVLTANGVNGEHSDRIYLERGMVEAIRKWEQEGYRDHTSGETFADAQVPL